MLSILGYVCFYPNSSTLELFGKVLQVLIKDKSPLSGYVLSTKGKDDFRKKAIKKDDVITFISSRAETGFNQLVARGQFDPRTPSDPGGKIHLQFIPSPIDSIWKKFVEPWKTKDMTHPVWATLMGLASHERFATLRNITEYPNVIKIALECEEENKVGPDQLHALGESIAIAMHGTERWAMAFDAEKFIPPFPTCQSLTANPDTVGKMDRFLLMPHLLTGGSKSIFGDYVLDLEAHSPNLPMLKAELAEAEVVTIENWNERNNFFLPKWHEHKYPNRAP